MINIGEILNDYQQERIQGDQPRLIQGAQVTSHGDKIQGDRMCNSKPKEIRRYTPPTDNTKEPNHHSHPHSHTLTTAGENGLLQRDNTVLSTALRGWKSTGPPQGSVDLYTKYQETKPQPHTKHTLPPNTKTTPPKNTTTPTTTTNQRKLKKIRKQVYKT